MPTALALPFFRGVPRGVRPVVSLPVLLASVLLAACSRPAPAPEPVRAVRTQVVAAQAATSSVDYAGEVRARIESRLSFRVGGKITRRLVNLGQPVKAGQLLAELDPADLRLGQESAIAGLAAAQANLAQSEADFKRYQDLRNQGFISAADLERREAALKATRSAFDQARAQSSVQTNQAGYARLVSDVAGVVTGVDAEPGMVMSAGSPVVRVAQDGPRDVVFNVPEDKVASLRSLIGQKGALKVIVAGLPQPVGGTLRELAAAADPATRTFLAKADIGSADVRLGQSATVVIAGANPLLAATGVVPLPLVALTEQGGRSQVWVLDTAKMTVSMQPVEIVSTDGQQALIGKGLVPGQEVVIAGVHVLTPNQTVKRYVPSRDPSTAVGGAAQPPAVAASSGMAPAASTASAAR